MTITHQGEIAMPLLIATLFAFAGQAGAHDPYYLCLLYTSRCV